MFWERLRKRAEGLRIEYDPGKQEPVMRKSICTGETTAGLKDRENGHYTDLMLIRSEEDVRIFMKRCGITERPRTEY